LKNIPHEYYLKNKRKIVIDKNRAWSSNGNMNIIKEYITPNPKVILMIRPVEEIVKSFFSLYEKNNPTERRTFFQNTDPFISPFNALLDGILYHKENILLVSYSELVTQPQNTIKKIYDFLEIPEFTHNFERIATIFPEGDYHLPGLHEVRTSISKREINIELTEDEKAEVDYFQRKINIALKQAGFMEV
jgi:sulfotransferase